MAVEIRPMTENDRPVLLKMMHTFYSSSAVLSNGSEKIFQNDIDACLDNSPFLEGYAFVGQGSVIGYAMLAKSFSTEFGKPCVWIEDIYVEESYRKKGIGASFLQFVKGKYPNSLLKLEVETENAGAMRLYQKEHFRILPYTEMIFGE